MNPRLDSPEQPAAGSPEATAAARRAAWRYHLRRTHDAVLRSRAVADQFVRDAHAAGLPHHEIADAHRNRNRGRVGKLLQAPPPAPLTRPPALPAVVHLRARRCPDHVWDRVDAAMWGRGWHTQRDRAAAWHLASAGLPVVLVDLSRAPLDALPDPDVLVDLVCPGPAADHQLVPVHTTGVFHPRRRVLVDPTNPALAAHFDIPALVALVALALADPPSSPT